MAYTLIGSPRSPFVRICRMLMIQNQIPFDFRILNFVDDAAAAQQLAQESPINKIPILIADGQKIFDSRVILNYLTKKHRLRPLTLEEENFASVVYSCLDTGIVLFLLRRDGYDLEAPGFFLRRNRQRIPNGLKFVAQWADSLDPKQEGDWNYASMALFSFFHWARAREVLKISEYPEFAPFLERFAEAPGVRETSF